MILQIGTAGKFIGLNIGPLIQVCKKGNYLAFYIVKSRLPIGDRDFFLDDIILADLIFICLHQDFGRFICDLQDFGQLIFIAQDFGQLIFIAQDLEEGEPDFDETEDLQIRKLPLAEVVAMIGRGEITDAISVAALLFVDSLVD